MNLDLSPETIEELQVLAKQNNISVENVVESLLYFYQQNNVVELSEEEETTLNEAIVRDEADRAAGFKGYSGEEVHGIIEKALVGQA